MTLSTTFDVFAIYVVLVIKNPPPSARDLRDLGLIPGLGRSTGGGNGNPLQHSCLENPMDRGTFRATVHRITNSQTFLKLLSTHMTKNRHPAEKNKHHFKRHVDGHQI